MAGSDIGPLGAKRMTDMRAVQAEKRCLAATALRSRLMANAAFPRLLQYRPISTAWAMGKGTQPARQRRHPKSLG